MMRSIMRHGLLAALALPLLVPFAGKAREVRQPQAADIRPFCADGDFDGFLDAFIRYPDVRRAFTAPSVRVAAGTAAPASVRRDAYHARFPIMAVDWHYEIAMDGNGAPGRHVALITRHANTATWQAEWVEARFDDEGESSDLVAEVTGKPGRLSFTRSADECWQLTDDRREVPDSPFQPGPQRLACHIRSDRFLELYTAGSPFGRQEARRCLVLQERIDAVLADDPDLAALRRSIDVRMAELARTNPAIEIPLAEDDRHFRRSLMREISVLADDKTMTGPNRAVLKEQLEARLALLGDVIAERTEPAGQWRNASGTIGIAGDGGSYRIEGALADPLLLAWTCEFDERFDRDGAMLIHQAPGQEKIATRVEGGLLKIDHDGQSPSCGANGSLAGTYFPVR